MISIQDEIDELKRELAMREKVYPEWIVKGRISDSQAKKRIAVMRSCIVRLEKLAAATDGKQAEMF